MGIGSIETEDDYLISDRARGAVMAGRQPQNKKEDTRENRPYRTRASWSCHTVLVSTASGENRLLG
jgi:hypothetical protein